jgi:hypothetical protein
MYECNFLWENKLIRIFNLPPVRAIQVFMNSAILFTLSLEEVTVSGILNW